MASRCTWLAGRMRGLAGGSLRRCMASSRVPVTHAAIATPTPAAGWTSVASSVTSAGPMTKIISSATDSREYAVCSRAGSPSSVLQRDLTIGPTDGMDAPASAPVIRSVHNGARSSAQATNATVLSANDAASGRSTRCWPNRSASLAACGAKMA